MKAIELKDAAIGSVSSRADRSIRFSVETPELSVEEAAIILSLHGVAARILIEPGDAEEMAVVTTQREVKGPSQRLRGALYKVWQTNPEHQADSFDAYYNRSMEKLIEHVKSKIKD